MIEFHLNSRSGVAPYLQLIQQVRQALRLGLLRTGDQLPHRQGRGGLAGDQPEHRAQGLPAAGVRGPGWRQARGRHVRDQDRQRRVGRRASAAEPGAAAGSAAHSRRAWTSRASRRCFSGPSGPQRGRKQYDQRNRGGRGPRPRQAVRAPLGAVRLHAHHPGRARRRARRPERGRQDHADQPGHRHAGADHRHRSRCSAAGRPAAPISSPASATSRRTPRPTPG